MKDEVQLQFPGKPEYVRVARLVISGIASCAGFSVEEIDELKQTVGEACSNAVDASKRAGGSITLKCDVEDSEMRIEVSPVEGFHEESLKLDDNYSFQLFLIKTLMDEVEVVVNGNGTSAIRMTRRMVG